MPPEPAGATAPALTLAGLPRQGGPGAPVGPGAPAGPGGPAEPRLRLAEEYLGRPSAALPAVGEAAWERAVALLGPAEEVDLVCHVSPDGDALGSALAAALGLRARGTRVRVSFGDDPQVIPDSLGFLPGQDLIVPVRQIPAVPELMVVLDVASEARLGLLRERAEAARELIVLDHHASNTGFGTVGLVDPEVPATAVLVDELLRRLEVPMTPEIAACLYTGVATDTGSFKYSGTTPQTHELAGRLLATGIRQDRISRRLWDTASFGYLKVLSAALDRAELDPGAASGRGLVWTVVPHADRQRHSVPVEELEGLIDVVRRTDSAEVALVLKEQADGSYYGSARAKGGLDLGPVCTAMGGGGHAFAAGFTSLDGVDVTVERFRRLLDAAPGSGAHEHSTGAGPANDCSSTEHGTTTRTGENTSP